MEGSVSGDKHGSSVDDTEVCSGILRLGDHDRVASSIMEQWLPHFSGAERGKEGHKVERTYGRLKLDFTFLFSFVWTLERPRDVSTRETVMSKITSLHHPTKEHKGSVSDLI